MCHYVACRILVPHPGIELVSPALGTPSLNHWTTREVPSAAFLSSSPQHTQISTSLPSLTHGSLPIPQKETEAQRVLVTRLASHSMAQEATSPDFQLPQSPLAPYMGSVPTCQDQTSCHLPQSLIGSRGQPLGAWMPYSVSLLPDATFLL